MPKIVPAVKFVTDTEGLSTSDYSGRTKLNSTTEQPQNKDITPSTSCCAAEADTGSEKY